MPNDLAGTHDLARLIFTLNKRRIRGGGENDLVNIVKDENNYTKKTGSTGRATRSKLNNRGAQITLTLMQTDSEDIRYIDSIANLPSPLDVFEIFIQDLNTLETVLIPQAWLLKDPDLQWNREAGNRVYVFDTPNTIKK